MKKYNLRLIKSRESHSFREISQLFSVHVRTVQIWKNQGLKVLNNSRPFLVMGSELETSAKNLKNTNSLIMNFIVQSVKSLLKAFTIRFHLNTLIRHSVSNNIEKYSFKGIA